VSAGVQEWRVSMWFLCSGTGWANIRYAGLKAKDRNTAIARAAQRAANLGFTVNGDTLISARRETWKGMT
jgi:hypothetical protein